MSELTVLQPALYILLMKHNREFLGKVVDRLAVGDKCDPLRDNLANPEKVMFC